MEGLKWLAFICMIIDHGNKFIPSFNLHYLSFIGRLAMPLFAFIFGYSLNYFELGNRKKVYSLLIRLLFTALIAILDFTLTKPKQYLSSEKFYSFWFLTSKHNVYVSNYYNNFIYQHIKNKIQPIIFDINLYDRWFVY